MELRQLRHFVAVAEEGSFTVAAQRMNIVQSALSTSVRSLEDELDAKLFARTTRHVRLTAAGRAFLGKAREALDAIRGQQLAEHHRQVAFAVPCPAGFGHQAFAPRASRTR